MSAPRRLVFLTLTIALLASGRAGAAPFQGGPAAPAGVAEGKAALEAAPIACRQAGPFRETLEFTLELPDGRREPRRQEYGVGALGEACFSLASGGQETMRFVARDGRMVGTQFNVEGRYAEDPYKGDFADALRRMGGWRAGEGDRG